MVKNTSQFYYVVVDYKSLGKKLNITYLMLERIANLIIEIKYELLVSAPGTKSLPKVKPLVLAIQDKERSCYYVLGTNGTNKNRGDVTTKNSFGNRFRKAAEESKVRYSCDSFESSLIEIYETDFESFLDFLIK